MTVPQPGVSTKETPDRGNVSALAGRLLAEDLVPGLLGNAVAGGDARVTVPPRPASANHVDGLLHLLDCFAGTADDLELGPRVSELDQDLPCLDPG